MLDKYNNTYLNTIKIKAADVKSNSYAEYDVDSDATYLKFKTGDDVSITEFKNIFC